ncbi:MAG: ATP-binding protein [Candidatus Dojkabacteria bacterium]
MQEKNLLNDLLQIPAETQTIEFKRLNGSKVVDKIIRTIVAMGNAEGGLLVLGIDDPEKTTVSGMQRIYGIEENLEIFDSIGEEIKRIIPPLVGIWPPEKLFVEEIHRNVALLHVPKLTSNFCPINNKVYVRQEKSNRLLTPQEIIKFSYAKGFQKADRELVNIDFELIDTTTYKTWKKSRRIEGDDIKDVLFRTGLARKNNKGQLKPTLASVLLFAEYPNDILETRCTIRVLQYAGQQEMYEHVPNLLGVPRTIDGPIIQQLQESHEYVLSLLRSGIQIPSGFTTTYKIPERAIKEALTNAVIHRDYNMHRDIEVKIFEDRIEVISPGLFPYNITKYNIGTTRSDGYRNDLLVKHLREFPEPPNLNQNEGVKAMRNEMKARGLYPPVFVSYPEFPDSVAVILRNEEIISEWDKVSHFLENNLYITNEEARTLTGTIQRDRMSKMLKNWVNKGLLIQLKPRSGFMKGVRYRLPSSKEVHDQS